MSQQSFCSSDDPVTVFYYAIFLPTTSMLFALSIVPALPNFYKAFKDGKLKSNNFQFYSTLFIFVTIFLYFVFNTPYLIGFCFPFEGWLVLSNIVTQLYAVQALGSVSLLYLRLYFVFKNTSYELSRCLNVSYGTWFGIAFICFSSAMITHSNFPGEPADLAALATTLAYPTLLMAENILFVRTLLKVHKGTQDSTTNKSKSLMPFVSRTTWLGAISTGTNFLNGISASLNTAIGSTHFNFVFYLIGQIDAYANFACVFLLYKHYHKLYKKVCRDVDTRCWLACWVKCCCVEKKVAEKELRGPTSMTSVDSSSPNSPATSVDGTNDTAKSAASDATVEVGSEMGSVEQTQTM